ncbi:TPA: LysR family transcriptional regulator, partial [Klebsiella pneumoniae]
MLAQQNILALLHTFECAALHMSFTRAANILNLTQGAVSQRIRHLEEMLGFRLFIRLTRKLQLTNEGARLLGILSSSLKRIDDEIEDIRVQGLRGTLSVGLPPTFSFIWLMPRLEEFALRWPNLNINF